MSTQIAFTLPTTHKKQLFQQRLAQEGLTTKSFFSFCVDAYLDRQIRFGIVNTYSEGFENLNPEEIENVQKISNLNSFIQSI